MISRRLLLSVVAHRLVIHLGIRAVNVEVGRETGEEEEATRDRRVRNFEEEVSEETETTLIGIKFHRLTIWNSRFISITHIDLDDAHHSEQIGTLIVLMTAGHEAGRGITIVEGDLIAIAVHEVNHH